ncbi:SDR family NAD(P)-dependent oxidoreductase [Kitasatospora azatica]|uniref:SDR family NAD(P)-dependent oxidoreductase n=1 Tax=Kitasatospora azatica TaxID=58347 RepID=UPI00055A680A|nr:SDR family oxidoreductase [Kitasatospora azatica]
MAARNILITGGSAGIGRACVERFARAGDNVWFTYRLGAERAAAIVAEVNQERPGAARAFAFDQGNWPDQERLLAELPGPVHVLVNNAAVGSATVARYAGPHEPEQDEAMLRINALGPLWLSRALLPQLIRQGGGKIINVSSVGGGVSQFPGFRLADGMSKAALCHLTRQLAAELVHQSVHVFAICPGAVDTGMFEASTLDPLTPENRAELLKRLPQGRLIEPAEVAELIWWLAGPASGLLHGAVIDASMGLGVHPGLLTGHEH